jgi:hypothetical protein
VHGQQAARGLGNRILGGRPGARRPGANELEDLVEQRELAAQALVDLPTIERNACTRRP